MRHIYYIVNELENHAQAQVQAQSKHFQLHQQISNEVDLQQQQNVTQMHRRNKEAEQFETKSFRSQKFQL